MPALCWHRAHAAGPVLLACKAGHPRPDPAHLCGRSVAKNENRLVRSGNRRSVFGRPRRRRCAANCRRCRQPRSATARPATRADPVATAMSTGTPSHGSPKRIVRRGSGRRLGRLAFVASERAQQFPRLGEDPGGTQSVGRRMPPWHRRSRWGPRSTGASAPARFPGAARPGRHEPAEPVLATLGAGQRRAGSGGDSYSRGCRLPPHILRRPWSTAWKGTERQTAGHAGHAWAVQRVMRGFTDRLSRVFSTRYEEYTVDPAGPE